MVGFDSISGNVCYIVYIFFDLFICNTDLEQNEWTQRKKHKEKKWERKADDVMEDV